MNDGIESDEVRGLPGYGSDPEQSRGERFDEPQGGGRDAQSVSTSGESEAEDGDDLLRDQRDHQDRGQSDIEQGESEDGRR